MPVKTTYNKQAVKIVDRAITCSNSKKVVLKKSFEKCFSEFEQNFPSLHLYEQEQNHRKYYNEKLIKQ